MRPLKWMWNKVADWALPDRAIIGPPDEWEYEDPFDSMRRRMDEAGYKGNTMSELRSEMLTQTHGAFLVNNEWQRATDAMIAREVDKDMPAITSFLEHGDETA
jgi:hypothetical protein